MRLYNLVNPLDVRQIFGQVDTLADAKLWASGTFRIRPALEAIAVYSNSPGGFNALALLIERAA